VIVEKEIARGGFGKVEQVRMPDGTRLAKKTFAPAMVVASPAELEKLKTRFSREVRVQSLLKSKSFIPIISSDLSAPEPSYLMPLADRNFYEQIEFDRIGGEVPQNGLADILNALEELHQLGFVHRDLKPQNILFHDGTWKLTDFGLVLPPSTGTTKLTSVDSNWGTAAYCAPEQAIDFGGATPAVDIYAFGCILHDIYSNTSRIPYQRQSAPGVIGGVIEKCTEQRPEKRFKNVQALRGTLLTLLSSASSITASSKAAKWADAIKDIQNWDADKTQAFARYVSYASAHEDKYAVYSALDEDALTLLRGLDSGLWKYIALQYCDWVEESGFSFEYCDVVAKRLELIFQTGDLECKAAAVMAAAKLANSHNRWYVMGYVLKLCGPSLEDNEAQRIAIEIKAADAAQNFRRCAEGIGKAASDYHPRIATVLVEI
jgi:eukaryotic-like serine/threonine-protein kinase